VKPRSAAEGSGIVDDVATWVRGALPLEALKRLSLTPEEGFVLSRLDVGLTTSEVSALTGFPPERAAEILERLAQAGAVKSDAPMEDASTEPAAAEEAEADAEPEPSAVNEAGYRKIYETQFRRASQGEKITAARTASESELMALCLDQDLPVFTAVLDNSKCGLPHVRFAARWHPTAAGLEAIGQRGALFNDPQVQRMLLRNVHLSELLTKRLLNGKRMLDSYKVSVDTDVPERARMFARSVLRSKFGTSQGEERAGIICATDGRVLAALAGLTLDGRATSILCARSYTSALFVQSLARFGSCPPPLLAHLLRQPLVRRQQHLKNMLLQHPNMPAEAKRRM
jgi:hypothetical protein